MADPQEKEELGVPLDRKSCDEDASLLEEYDNDSENGSTIFPPSPEGRKKKSYNRLLPDFLLPLQVKIVAILLAILDILLPSFIPRWASASKETINDRWNSPTAYLDGLRGVATVIVYLHHFVLNWFPDLTRKYGETPEDVSILQLPIVRIIFAGRSAVAVFFIVSGYALSYSALSKVRKGQRVEALNTLSSSTFRRSMRLTLPCAANSLFSAWLAHYGYYTHDPLHWNTIPPYFPSLIDQLLDWWEFMRILTYPFNYVEGIPWGPQYNGHMWTIPFEIRGSWVTYGTVLASANLTPGWRMAFLIWWDCYLWYMAKWDLFLFVTGILIANVDVTRHIAAAAKATTLATVNVSPNCEPSMIEMTQIDEESSTSTVLEKPRPRAKFLTLLGQQILTIIQTICPLLPFIFALYLLSFETLPWGNFLDILISWTPETWNHVHQGNKNQAWRCIGAAILTYSISLSPYMLQPLFTNSVSRYLGRISFGVYLMHGPVLFCLGTTAFLVPAWTEDKVYPDAGRYVRRFLWAAIWNTVVVFWSGDLFSRWVDEKSVVFAGWVMRVVSGKR